MTQVIKSKRVISKSRYLNGLQCSKLLWNQTHAKEQLPSVDAATQAIFDQGHEVTQWAQKLFPKGIEITGSSANYGELFHQTEEYLKKGKPLFEAAFQSKNTFARPDIIVPNKDGSWDIFEVKSSTTVKDINLHDLAFQKYCYEGAGLKIRKTNLVYINNEYVRDGDIDVSDLFQIEDLTAEVAPLALQVEGNMKAMLKTLDLPNDPQVRIGPHCLAPYECSLKNRCWDFLPEDSVLTLNRIPKKKAFEWVNSGIQKILDIPESEDLSEKHIIQRECARTGKPYMDKKAIQTFLDSVQFPAYLVDFETCKSAVPFFDGSRPYQQIPFQFSLLVWQKWDSKPKHLSFLWKEKTDPRPEFMKALVASLGDKGSILAYNLSFEKGCIANLVEIMPQYETWWKATQSRLQDLLIPFRNFHYYHPDQQGSASIKSVYPAIAGGSYEGLEIADGTAASDEYTRFVKGGMTDDEAQKLFKALEIYCALDTQAMADLMTALKVICK